MRCWTTTIGHATDRRDDRVVEHRIINNGDGGWRVHCDEAWGEGNGTDDWPAMHGAYCTRHHHRHRHRDDVSNKTPPPTELQIPATVTTLVIAVATNFGTKIAITGFMRTTATRHLVMEGVWVVGRENVNIASTLHNAPTGHCHGNHFLAFYIWGAYQRHLANMTSHLCVAAMRPYVKLLWVDHLFYLMLQASLVFLLVAMPGFHTLIVVALSIISASEHAGILYTVLWLVLLSFFVFVYTVIRKNNFVIS